MALLGACCVFSACGGTDATIAPSAAARRLVAEQFAEAIFRGDAPAAVALLASPDALSSSVSRAAAPWQAHHARLRLPGRLSGSRWVFGYSGVHPHAGGRFDEVRGDLVVVVTAVDERAGVGAFAFQNTVTRSRTHHDSVLLPSDR